MKYFKLYELLPKEEYINETTGWDKLDPKLLTILDEVREILGIPLTCNNWLNGGTRNNCGFRCQDCPIGVPNSFHKKGMAADLISPKMTGEQMRQKIIKNASKLSYPIRLENNVPHLHIDVHFKPGIKVYTFNP